MKSVIEMWHDRLPIAVIASQHNMKRQAVIAQLGDLYSKNEAHYRANEYRDRQRQANLVAWFQQQFDLAELQQAINTGSLQAYWQQIAQLTKVTTPTVRRYMTQQLGALPPRQTAKSAYNPKTYRLGKKSTYYQRETELIAMWQQDGMSINAIAKQTGVSQRSLHKLLDPLGYVRVHDRPKRPVVKVVVLRPQRLHSRRRDTPLARKRRANQAKNPAIIKTILSTNLTTHEIAKQYQVTDRKVQTLAQQQGVNMRERTINSYPKRVNQISNALLLSEKAMQTRLSRRHAQANIQPDYLGEVADWVWSHIDRQPEPLLLDKILHLINDKPALLAFLQTARKKLGHNIGLVELEMYLPKIEGVDAWFKLVSQAHAYDSDIASLTSGQSQYERRFAHLLDTLDVSYKVRDRHLGFEFDFYLPERGLAFELSPLATHNSNSYQHYGLTSAEPKPVNYHYHKWLIAQRAGINLITLFEKQLDPQVWTTKTVPMVTRLVQGYAPRTVYARNVIIRQLDRPRTIVDEFLDKYHMDGKTSAKYRYGLYTKSTNELVGVATFGLPTVPKYKQANLLELKRLAFKSDVQVRYGISKIISHVLKDHADYAGILTFSNNNMGYGRGYQQAGFELLKTTDAQLTFINPRNVQDTYSWSVATPWSAKTGVLAKYFGRQDLTSQEARQLVETALPHRADNGKGYVAQYDTGNRVWVKYR